MEDKIKEIQKPAPPKLTILGKTVYALAKFGWSLTSFAVINLVIYFYMPPENSGTSIFPILIFQGSMLGIMTVIGFSNFIGRIFDSITDPIIASMSDRSRSRLGRRTFFMAVSVLPFAVFSVLVFMPPSAGVSVINSIWVIVSILLFYFFMTMYVVPYESLLPEIGHTAKERLDLCTITSLAWALGFGVGQAVHPIQTYFEGTGMSAPTSFRITVAIFAGIGFICMMMPVLFLNEKKYCGEKFSNEGTFKAVIAAFKNRNFLMFTLSDLMYWVANTFLEVGIIYYVTILLKMEKEVTFTLMAIMFVVSFILYLPINLITKKTGKKKILTVGFIINSILFAMIPFLGKFPGLSAMTQGCMIILLSAIPVAIFGIIPGAIAADIAASDAIATGSHKEGVFLAARTFAMKIGIAITNMIFPSLLLLGRSIENPLGVRLTGFVALFFTLTGYFILRKYKENEVNQILLTVEDE
ncbi:MAG: MFS transporter [Spirochaetales bacterium]|nr:MFS transporter [Spirochaetales bacterium]